MNTKTPEEKFMTTALTIATVVQQFKTVHGVLSAAPGALQAVEGAVRDTLNAVLESEVAHEADHMAAAGCLELFAALRGVVVSPELLEQLRAVVVAADKAMPVLTASFIKAQKA